MRALAVLWLYERKKGPILEFWFDFCAESTCVSREGLKTLARVSVLRSGHRESVAFVFMACGAPAQHFGGCVPSLAQPQPPL